ncbi:MAG TPA: hypothetical protein VFB45_14315 [Pseudolabrys sp.]|nr:hypothetical protein [Pseudolabrys sp.]
MLMRSRAKFRLHVLLAAAVALSFAIATPLYAADADKSDDDQNSGFDHEIFKSVLKNLGLYNEGNEINYRERSPLVVPPSRNLPPPVTGDAAIDKNPAWPIDPEVKAARLQKKLEAGRKRSFEEESKPLPPDQLRGPPPAPGSNMGGPTGRAKDNDNPVREGLNPGENLWNSLFAKDEQSAPFKGEPPRVSLTEPPPGYQTPSANFPYGINTKEETKATPKKLDIER